MDLHFFSSKIVLKLFLKCSENNNSSDYFHAEVSIITELQNMLKLLFQKTFCRMIEQLSFPTDTRDV